MQRLQAFKFQLRPSDRQEQQMRCFAGTCRAVYNEALRLQEERHAQGEKKLSYAGLCKELTAWRGGAPMPSGRVAPWLADTPCGPQQQKLIDLERAYTNFFAKRASFPRPKKKGRHDSFRYPNPKKIKLDQGGSRIYLPKLGWLRYRNSRNVLGAVRNVTVSLSCGKWYISILTRQEVAEPVHPASSIVGIDMGVAHFATISTGETIEPLNSFKRHKTALRKAGQALSRKVKYSKNWKKAKARVQRIHSHIGNARRDFLHKTSTTISKNHAVVCIEDLQVRNMSKSATGSAEKPGKNVRTKAGLNRSILDQGWFEFRRQLEYKQAWRGGMVIAVDPRNTSRTCPCCGHVSAENRRTQARFECVECGFKENADVVGAINILARGQAVLRGEGRDTGDASPGWETTARIACEVSGAVMPPAAGTHRSVQTAQAA